MITFKAFVPTNARRADGSYPVKIRCTVKRKSRWLPTNITVTDADLTRSKKIKNQYVNARCEVLVRDLRDAVADLSPFAVDAMEVDDVVKYIKRKREKDAFKLDFFEFGRAYAAGQTESTGKVTLTALNAFARFLGEDRCDVNEVTATMIREFVEFLDNEPKVNAMRNPDKKGPDIGKRKGVAAYKYVSVLRTIYKRAREKYNDEDAGVILIPRAPFDRVNVPIPVYIGQRPLGIDVIQKMLDTETTRASVRFALDVFIITFATMGANMADLYDANPPAGGNWVYNRKKTEKKRKDRARMELSVHEKLAPILERLKDPTGQKWLCLHLRGKDASAVGHKVNNGLKAWAEDNGIEPFTFYAARHSWASIARSKAVGIDKATVDDCLNHATMALADIYIARDFTVFDEANAKVLSKFRFPGEDVDLDTKL